MYPFKLSVIPILLLVISSMLVCCSVNSDSSAELKIYGSFYQISEGQKVIYELKTHSDMLYAGTDTGLHKLNLDEKTWKSLGIDAAEVRTFAIITDEIMLAPLNFNDGDSLTIAKTTNGGQTWIPFRNGYGGGMYQTVPTSLVSLSQLEKQSSILYAAGPLLTIAKLKDQEPPWKVQFGSWEGLGSIVFIQLNPTNSEIVWSGGTSATFRPLLLNSTDGGNTWQKLSIYGGGANVNDVAIHPSQSNTIIAGLAGITANMIRKSTDGGQSWTTTLEGVGVRTLAHSARNPEIVYASGINENGTLFFAKSPDFGESWETVEWEESPAGVQVNDMVSVMEDGGEVLYLGTNQGVFSYMFKE